jgi:hypothetical protein
MLRGEIKSLNEKLTSLTTRASLKDASGRVLLMSNNGLRKKNEALRKRYNALLYALKSNNSELNY